MIGLLSYSFLYAVSAGILRFLGFALSLWLARSLPIEDYATYGLYFALQQGVSTFALAGIIESTIGLLGRYRAPHERMQLFTSSHFAFLLLAIAAIVVVAMTTVLFFGPSKTVNLVYWSAIGGGVLLAFASFQTQIVRLEERHMSSILFSFVPLLLATVGAYSAFMYERTVPSLFVGAAFGLVLSLVGLRACGAGLWQLSARPDDLRRILIGATPFAAVAFLGWLSGYGSNYLIDRFFADTDVAKFTFLLSLCSVLALIAGAVNQVWSPRFYRLIHETKFHDVEAKNSYFYRFLGLALGLSGGIVVLFFSTAIDLLQGNLGSYKSMNLELSLLFAGYVVLTPWWHCQNHFLAHGMGQQILRVTLVTSSIGIAGLLILMWWLGPIGVYVGFLVQMCLRTQGFVVAARRRWPITVSWSGSLGGLLAIFSAFELSSTDIPLVTSTILYLLFGSILLAVQLRKYGAFRSQNEIPP